MRVGILGFVGGAACLQTRAALPDYPVLALAVVLIITLAALVWLRRARPGRAGPLRRGAFSLTCGAAIGFFWAATLAQAALAPQLARADEGRDITLVGTVASLPFHFEQGVRFQFAVEQVLGSKVGVPPKIALAWYAGYRDTAQAVGDVQPGERWQLTVRLQRPHGNANPHTFDYEVWLLEQGLRATGYVRPDQGMAHRNQRLERFVFSFGNVVESCRAMLRARIVRSLAGKEYAGVIVALVVGDQRAIEQSDWQVFNRTGISHLVSISGLHITMVAGLFALIASTLWRHSFFTGLQLPLMLPAQKVAALAGTAVALLYVLLAGFGVPAQRTLYMLAVVALSLWLGRMTSVGHVLCNALALVVVFDPWAILWPGFWLSFGAVAIIVYAGAGRGGGVARRAAARRADPVRRHAGAGAADDAAVRPGIAGQPAGQRAGDSPD